MIYTLRAPRCVNAVVDLPASKSISNRILILNALSSNPAPITHLSESDDTQVLLRALQSSDCEVNIGAAGTAMRFLTAYFSQIPDHGERILTGSARMQERPIGLLVDALRQCGAEIRYLAREGFPPLSIRGKHLPGGAIELDGGVSSQFISALLMIGPVLERGLTLRLRGTIVSRPYIRMTLSLMEAFGVQAQWRGAQIEICPQPYRPIPYRIESDWSAASYWYEIQALAAPGSRVDLPDLNPNSLQGDAKTEYLFRQLTPGKELFEYDFVDEPDLAQTLIVTSCLLDIPFRFSGLQSLRIKETDRLLALQTELRKLGYAIQTEGNSLAEWRGQRCPPEANPVIATYDDHRMAMAFAPVCLKTGVIQIAHPEVVGKSYPRYWADLLSAGFTITEQ
jgi:3-phosphoshikimate 1-carboxyvinyltransferase